jgi:hypothetical protein
MKQILPPKISLNLNRWWIWLNRLLVRGLEIRWMLHRCKCSNTLCIKPNTLLNSNRTCRCINRWCSNSWCNKQIQKPLNKSWNRNLLSRINLLLRCRKTRGREFLRSAMTTTSDFASMVPIVNTFIKRSRRCSGLNQFPNGTSKRCAPTSKMKGWPISSCSYSF